MKLEIYNEADRLEVAAILVKNGYRVCQGKERRSPTSKAYTYYIEAEKVPQQTEAKNGES